MCEEGWSMANEEHLAQLQQGVEAWNQWREEHQDIKPDLTGADLRRANLSEADLRGANLYKANLRGADLGEANLTKANLLGARLLGANLSEADLRDAYFREAELLRAAFRWAKLGGAYLGEANLREASLIGADLTKANLAVADLRGADLRGADLYRANLSRADLGEADLRGATLERALLIETNLRKANLTGCRIYGVAAWGVHLEEAHQTNLVITPDGESEITVDNLEVAQFIYLLLHNEKIREVIDTIGQKGVLILGRFADERKTVLDSLRTALRSRGFLPMVFDFEKPTQRDFTETIMTLAGLSLFVIADITNPRSTPLELQATVPDYMIPFVPIIAEGEPAFAMFIDLQRKFDWVLDVLIYDSVNNLLAALQDAVIAPALQKHEALVQRRARIVGMRHIQQYLPDGEAHP
jgi:uncharacterized protein YjbI with pentapeptide repeats